LLAEMFPTIFSTKGDLATATFIFPIVR
jgi:hypothetical protein